MYGLKSDFFQHATDRNQIWRILLGLFVISGIYFIFIFATIYATVQSGFDLYQVMMSGSPSGLALIFLSFFAIWL